MQDNSSNNFNMQSNQIQNNNIPSSNIQNTATNNNKIIIAIIIIIIILIFIGFISFYFMTNKSNKNIDNKTIIEKDTSEKEPENNNNETYEISNNWKEFIVSINNKTYNIPFSYKDLKETSGFSMNEDEEKEYIEPNYYKLENLFKNGKLALYSQITNYSQTTIQEIDSKISRIGQTKYIVNTNGIEAVIFPGNLTVNTSITKDKIISLFGEPDDIKNYNDNNYNKDTYTYYIDKNIKTYNYYRIDVVNGIIDELTLDHKL